MTGQLNEHPLTELVREIASEKLSGSLRLEHERFKTAIYFEAGALVYATSNLRVHRLAEWLRRSRVLTDQQLAAAAPEGKTDAELGAALVAKSILTKETLGDLRARQVADVIRPALLWTEGSWNYDPRVRLAEDVRVYLELPALLMEGARRLPADFAARRFPNINEKLSPVALPQSEMNLLPTEGFILSRIDGPVLVRELVAISGLPEAEALHTAYALSLGGFIARESWPRAFTPEEIEKAQAIAASTTAQAAPGAPEPQKAEVEKPAPESEVDDKKELEELFARVGRAADFYQVMGVTRNADMSTIKRTYHNLARRFHPDLFHQDQLLHNRVEVAFAKIAQAYETLKDRTARANYDLKLERNRQQSGKS